MAKVILRNVYKKYTPARGGITAVSDFNLSIEDKEMAAEKMLETVDYKQLYNFAVDSIVKN